jgi:energy-coupling factor transport system substrate-specific component
LLNENLIGKGIIMIHETVNFNKSRIIALIPFGIALNIALGTLTSTLKIPLYLDAVATIAITILVGFKAGAIVGILSFVIAGIFINPILPWFCGTQFLIAAYVAVVARKGLLTGASVGEEKHRTFIKYMRIIIIGVGLGILAGIASAPVIVILFSGLTGSGPSLVVAFLLRSGQTLYKSVLLSGFASEPLDKTIQLILALMLIQAIPSSLKLGFGGGYLKQNNLI